MSIVTTKVWTVFCATDGCGQQLELVEGTWSEWTGERIYNHGQLTDHLRRAGWTVGKTVLCLLCVRSPR